METKPKVRVLVVGPGSPLIGGQSVQAELLIQRLDQEEEVEVGFLPVNPVFIPFLQKIKFVRTLITTFRYLISLLANIPKYDVIHIFSASFSSFLLAPAPAIVVSKLFRKKTLLNYHSGFLAEHLDDWPKTTLPLINKCDLVITPSNFLVDVFSKYGVESKAILNMVPTGKFKFLERPELEPKFLSNRNFEELYNIECTLRAFGVIQNEIPEASIIVAGSGPLESDLKQFSADIGLRNIEFLGQVSQDTMAECYARSDIYLNSSNVDNMPVSILEAFASGTPVVSTNAGGIPYIVEHEANGLLVELDDHEALASEAIRLLRDPELANKLVSAAKKDLAKYSWESVGSQWLAAYTGN